MRSSGFVDWRILEFVSWWGSGFANSLGGDCVKLLIVWEICVNW